MRTRIAVAVALLGMSGVTAQACVSNSTPPAASFDGGGLPDATLPGDDGGPARDGAPADSPSDAAAPIDASASETGRDAGPQPPSCTGLAATCGPTGDDSCCATLPVPGGTFNRGATGNAWDGPPATISTFNLDKYEVTVGRFRQFVLAGQGTQASPPAADAGAGKHTPGSGWDPSFNADLPIDAITLHYQIISCQGTSNTWADAGGPNDDLPMDCVSWPIAFAFCAWDNARLPTDAEWTYATAGGSEQRDLPWLQPDAGPYDGSAIDPSFAQFGCSPGGMCAALVGTHPNGAGRWGHLDLSGNVHELTRDYKHPVPPSPCIDCADLDASAALGLMFHGGSYRNPAVSLPGWTRFYNPLTSTAYVAGDVGIRCARDL